MKKKLISLLFLIFFASINCFSSKDLHPESPLTPTCFIRLFDPDSELLSPRTTPITIEPFSPRAIAALEEETIPINIRDIVLETQNAAIRRIASTIYPPDLPGLAPLLNTATDGASFELESALYAEKELGETILGFGLELVIKEGVVQILLDGEILEMRTTEYDVVTQNYVIESKSSGRPGRHARIDQFEKEKTMLLWLKVVLEEMVADTMAYGITYDPDIEGVPFFTINGAATCYQEISFTCNWIPYLDDEQFIFSWIQLIRMLSQKTLLVFFKNTANAHLRARLEERDLEFYDEVTHGTFLNTLDLSYKTFELDEAISPRSPRVATPRNDIRDLFVD